MLAVRSEAKRIEPHFCTCICTCVCIAFALACALAFPLTYAIALALAFALAVAFAKPNRSQNGPKTDPNGGKNGFKLGRTGLDRTGSGRIRVGSDFGRLHVQKSYVFQWILQVAAIRASPQLTGPHRKLPDLTAAQFQTLPIC